MAELATWTRDLREVVHSIHAPICDGFRNGQWGRAFSNASSRCRPRQEAIDETRAALDAARELGPLRGAAPRPSTRQTIPAGDNDRRRAGVSRRSRRRPAAARVKLALEVIPNELSSPAALADLLNDDLELGDAGICPRLRPRPHDDGSRRGRRDAGRPPHRRRTSTTMTAATIHLVPFSGTINWTHADGDPEDGHTGPAGLRGRRSRRRGGRADPR